MAGKGGDRLAVTSRLLRGSHMGRWHSHGAFSGYQADTLRQGRGSGTARTAKATQQEIILIGADT